jgi:SAM-dependent methyltransferase
MQAQTPEWSAPLRKARVNGLTANICLALVRSFSNGWLSRLGMRRRALGERFESRDRYLADRVSNMERYRELFSPFCRFQGKVVLELGCSEGYLLASFLQFERFTAIGADIDPAPLARGRAQHGDRIKFVQSTASCIPLPGESVDAIYTIDTVEHLSEPAAIMKECYRVLRPGGVFLIHFGPWRSHDGSHLEDIITFPWPHVFFSMDTLLKVAASLYDSGEYKPACYWLDPETGAKRPNPYLDRERWRVFLNRMTIAGFRRLLRQLPFEVVHFRRIGFGGKAFPLARALKGLAQAPVLNEFVTRTVFCVLRRPAA